MNQGSSTVFATESQFGLNLMSMAAMKSNCDKNGSNHAPPPAPPFQQEEVSAPPAAPPPEQRSQAYHVKGAAQELASVPSSLEKERAAAQFMKSVNELGTLSTFLYAFRRRFDELQNHLDFIQNAIDTRSQELLDAAPSSSSSASLPHHHNQQLMQKEMETAAVETVPVTKTDIPSAPAPSAAINTAGSGSVQTQKQPSSSSSLRSELEYLCEVMCSRGLRKYIVSHLSDARILRQQVPAALKCAPKPARLVLECIGRFFLQGSRAFSKDSPMIPARQASLLILESFLLTGCSQEIHVEPSVKQEADLAAIAWRRRLISEGGVSRASHIDARGLLLFVASFGIPSAFGNEDLTDLIRLSDSREVADALRCSHLLLTRIPDIIEGMMNNGMDVEAVDVAYTFGFEGKFPPQTILTSFLRESKEAWKRIRTEAHGSPLVLKEANEKQLAALKSIIKCLEERKIDPSKFLPGWQIKEKIIKLEKDIADLEKKMEVKVMAKRKVDEIQSIKLKSEQMKRLRFYAQGSPLISPSVIALQERRVTKAVDGKSLDDGFMPLNSLDGELPGHVSSYPAASSALYRSGVGSLPESVFDTMVVGGGGRQSARVGTGMSAGIGVPSTGLFAGVHGNTIVDKVGPIMTNSSPLYRWHGIEDASFNNRSVGHSFVGQPAASMGLDGLFGPSPSVEDTVSLPNSPSIGVANRSSAIDLYRFTDVVVENEWHHNNNARKAGLLPPVLSARHSSYFY